MKTLLSNKLIILIFSLATLGLLFFSINNEASAQLSDIKNAEISTEVHNSELLIYNVSVDDIRFNGAKITWDTNVRAVCVLFYGTTTEYEFKREESSYLEFHYFNLTQLLPDTLYHFKIYCTSYLGETASTDDYTFKTPAKKDVVPETIVERIILQIEKITEAITEEVKVIEEKYEEKVPVQALLPEDNCYSIIILNPIYQDFQLGLVLLALALALSFALYPEFANLPLLTLWDSILTGIAYIFGGFRKKTGWVYDAESNHRIPNAKVTLYDFETGKIIETVYTDYKGKYQLKAKAGKYYVEVERSEFNYPSVITKKNYHKEIIEQTSDDNITLSIPLDPDMKKLIPMVKRANTYTYYFSAVRIIALSLSTIINLIAFIFFPNLINLLLTAVIIVLWIVEYIYQSRLKVTGVIFESDCTPVDESIVRVFNEKGVLITTKANEESGYYFCKLFKGNYNFRATSIKLHHADDKDILIEETKYPTKNIYLSK